MENFEQNQNNENIENIVEDEFSTIFSDPTAHKKTAGKVKNRNVKRWMSIIAGVLSVAVLITGTFFVVKLIPEKEQEQAPINSQVPEKKILSLKEADFKNITVVNKNGTFVIDNTVSKDESGYNECVWSLKGYSSAVIGDTPLYNVASVLMNLSYIREIENVTDADYGFDKPVSDVTITKQDNTVHRLLFGYKTPDKAGVYVKYGEKCYMVLGDSDTRLSFNLLDLANTDPVEALTLPSGNDKYLSNGMIATFDSLTVSGKNFAKPVVIKPNPNALTAELHQYVLTSPVTRMAENVDKALAVFNNGVEVMGAYALDSSNATVKKFGLDKPDLSINVKLGKLSYTVKFKLQEDGNYAVWYDNCRMIKMVGATSLELFSYSTINFYSTWVHLQAIDELSGFVVKCDGKEYKFDISVKKNENTKNEYTIKYNGKTLTAINFQDFYRYCISLYASDFDVKNVNVSVEYELTYIYSDKSRNPTKITFKRSSATKYQYSINGEPIGNVNASDLNRIPDYVNKVINNQNPNVI